MGGAGGSVLGATRRPPRARNRGREGTGSWRPDARPDHPRDPYRSSPYHRLTGKRVLVAFSTPIRPVPPEPSPRGLQVLLPSARVVGP